MKNGPPRFEIYLGQLDVIFAEAGGQADPAMWLYRNNARTPLFMLEGLARLYSMIHNRKRFRRLEMYFKLVEDALGAIDYYDGFAKEFAVDKTAPAGAAEAVEAKALEKAALLNGLLKKNGWTGKNANRIAKIRGRLHGADWLRDKAEVEAIESVYEATIRKINAFAGKYEAGFTELETQVHELRRKLRWLSIYPQALQGCIQLEPDSSKNKGLAKYLTQEIVNSPFNKMPEAGDNRYLLMFSKEHFLALSWMIAELGTLKDQGLRQVVLNEIGIKSKNDRTEKAAILANASKITRSYFTGKFLDRMIKGVSAVKSKSG
jgi:hypothetical protein